MQKKQDYYIDIAMCFDEKIARQACVALKSIMQNKEKNNFIYRIHCVTSSKAKSLIDEYLNGLIRTYREKLCIQFHIIDDNPFEGAFEIRNITTTTYYRFLLSELLKGIDKVLYLDVDVLVCGDLKDLFQTEISEVYLCGVKNFQNLKKWWDMARKKFFSEQFEVCRGRYINAGVLLMNLKKIRESDMVSRWLELTQFQFVFQDQDIINLTCHSNIGFLPLRYNMFLGQRYTNRDDLIKENIYTEMELEDAIQSPVIIHFAGSKPWDSLVSNYYDMTKEWWKVVLDDAILYSWFKEDLLKCMSNAQNNYNVLYWKERRIFNWLLQLNIEDITFVEMLNKRGFKRIAIYGMGPVGEYLVKVLNDTRGPVCYGIDREKIVSKSGIKIYKPNDALPGVDAVINTVLRSHEEIKQLLTDLNCPIVSIDELMEAYNVLL